jgi:two-component system, sensor histidine kinase and response regulator
MRYSILVVDDNLTNLKLAALVLSPYYKLMVVDNGEKAIKIAESKLPEVILLDIMMPGMSGFDVCRQLKQNETTKDIPVIFLTAKTDEDDIETAFEAGGVDYITKPLKAKEALSRIKTQIDLKEARDILKKQNEELKLLIANRDKFFSIIAHDLRSPFNGFLNMTELLAEGIEQFSKAELTELSREMYKSTTNLYKLIENLLDWARMQNGKIEFKPVELDINKIVEESIASLNQRAIQKGILINNEMQKELKVYADEKMIYSVIRNLVSNAIKYTNRGGMVTVESGSSTDNEIMISVQDTGIGISDTNIAKLFRIEEKIKSIGTDGEPSAGLGLLLCKEFVEKHGGRIWAESAEGKGSSFYFTLPTNKQEAN